MPIKLLFLVGPTGVGKTELSIAVAKKFNCEIISIDSMQIYEHMDIGTAKATPYEQSEVTHHLIDIVNPNTRFTVSDYQEKAYETINKIVSKGKTPLFVGGTGLYLDSIIYDFKFANIDGSKKLRGELESIYDKDGGISLFNELKEVDPITASKLDICNKKRVIRALEIYRITGNSLSDSKNEIILSDKWDPKIFVLTDKREKLYQRINDRVDKMLKSGLIEENIKLKEMSIPKDSQSIQAIGYKEVQWYLDGLLTYDEMVNLLKKNSRNYAKRQLTWYRKYTNIDWIERSKFNNSEEIINYLCIKIGDFLNDYDK